MKIINIADIQDKSDFSVAVIDNSKTTFITISEGSGDNLLDEDRAEGFVDYINYSSYELVNNAFSELDGGMALLDKLYVDCTEESLISRILDETDLNSDNAVVVCLPYDATTSFFEDALNIPMDEFDYSAYDDDLLDIYTRIMSAIEEYV